LAKVIIERVFGSLCVNILRWSGFIIHDRINRGFVIHEKRMILKDCLPGLGITNPG